MTIKEKSVLGEAFKEIIFDFDDDSNEASNENPTLYIHRKIERGLTVNKTGKVVPFQYITTLVPITGNKRSDRTYL